MKSGPGTAVLLIAGAVLLLGAMSGVAQAQDERARELFNEAKDLWEQDRIEEAVAALRRLIAEDPSSETAYQLLREAETRMMLDLLVKGGESEKVARAILDLADRGEMERSRDEEAIKALTDRAIRSTDVGDRRSAVREIVARHGEYAVPYLYHYLGSNDTDERVNAILALTAIGTDAVLPLTEVLQSDNWLVQKNAALVLDRIKDVRALGGLTDLARRAENDAVRAAAAGAAVKVAGDMGEIDAVGAYDYLAERYYLRDERVIRNYAASYNVWSFRDGQLSFREVPRYLYHLELAEEAAYDALAVDPTNAHSRALLTAVHYAQWGTLQGLTPDVRSSEDVQALEARYWNVLPISAAQGADVQLAALSLGLKWNDPWIARQSLSALAAVWDDREIGEDSPLVAALSADDKTVRFAAAVTALLVDPGQAFPGSDVVIPLAAQAVATGSVRQVLLVESGAELRAKSLRALDEANIYAVAESTGIDGLIRAKEVGTFDAIILAYDLGEEQSSQRIVNELRRDFRTAQVPILISGTEEQLAEAREYFATKVQGFILNDPIPVEEVRQAAAQSMNDDQMRALAVAKAAAEGLASLNLGLTAFENAGGAEEALIGVLGTDRPEDLRIAVLSAIANVGSPASAEALVETLGQSANSTAVRVGAALALGEVLSGMAAPAAVYEALLSAAGDEAQEVRAAAGAALGSMMLTPEQALEVASRYRVE